MKIDKDHELARDTEIRDEKGDKIHYCFSFDTETKEAEMYVIACLNENGVHRILCNEGKAVTIKLTLPGAKAYRKSTGEEIV